MSYKKKNNFDVIGICTQLWCPIKFVFFFHLYLLPYAIERILIDFEDIFIFFIVFISLLYGKVSKPGRYDKPNLCLFMQLLCVLRAKSNRSFFSVSYLRLWLSFFLVSLSFCVAQFYPVKAISNLHFTFLCTKSIYNAVKPERNSKTPQKNERTEKTEKPYL